RNWRMRSSMHRNRCASSRYPKFAHSDEYEEHAKRTLPCEAVFVRNLSRIDRCATLTPRSDSAGAPLNDHSVGGDIAERYDAIAYASKPTALSHPSHLATVAALFGLDPP